MAIFTVQINALTKKSQDEAERVKRDILSEKLKSHV